MPRSNHLSYLAIADQYNSGARQVRCDATAGPPGRAGVKRKAGRLAYAAGPAVPVDILSATCHLAAIDASSSPS